VYEFTNNMLLVILVTLLCTYLVHEFIW